MTTAAAGRPRAEGYFTHRSFRARRPLRVGLAIVGSMAFQGPVITWVADHRRHHAFTDREGDPHSPWLFGTTHHADPTCARHGVGRGQIDITAQIIAVFERLGWASQVRWPPRGASPA